jgi:hypothetical protein
VSRIEPFPLRRIASLSAGLACAYLSAASHYKAIAQQDFSSAIQWGIPAPPLESFAEGFLAIPGVLAGLPVIILGTISHIDWITSMGLCLGAAFFWYCAGWYIDSVRPGLQADQPPRFATIYMTLLAVGSLSLLPVGMLAGLNVGNHYCLVNMPPYWSEILGYGILMFWLTIGAFFGWRTLRGQPRNPEGRFLN